MHNHNASDSSIHIPFDVLFEVESESVMKEEDRCGVSVALV